MKLLSLCLGLTLFCGSALAIEVYPFENEAQEALYQDVTKELRCLVCQNQNLADSDAGLATDLKDKVAAFVMEGKSKDEITQYMIDRYGEFVSYEPPLNASTLFLWLSPLVLLLIGGGILVFKIRRTQHD
ncbi:cytochrome c-type biogenesis protein [Marinicella rhabdoformis]|uniref:cytochrome c-type biogenesis protein n=1 Tax=Marinicella rhabdoformis TaxID=2580566 RepID=UPI0012AEDA18|nr:cytochrome c-type biogenesis protein [Marinicella rhabdoformis]